MDNERRYLSAGQDRQQEQARAEQIARLQIEARREERRRRQRWRDNVLTVLLLLVLGVLLFCLWRMNPPY
jgi:hypothetical protein